MGCAFSFPFVIKEPGNKESAASDLAECVKAFGIASLWKLGIHAALKAVSPQSGEPSWQSTLNSNPTVKVLLQRSRQPNPYHTVVVEMHQGLTRGGRVTDETQFVLE